ncbi:MAG: hypothetical protein GQ559_08545 [Desulfobulbaceae bacterium]|nr:hypothetical protein [Desulfobulbaceae bacterium]
MSCDREEGVWELEKRGVSGNRRHGEQVSVFQGFFNIPGQFLSGCTILDGP